MDGNLPKPKILVVDDTPANLRLIMETLKNDYKIVTALNGEKALILAATEPLPDLILLDVMMPEIDGYEVCARLKSDVKTKNIPIIFLTALNEEEDEARGLALGAADFITKPFRPGLVKARVRNHIELKLHRDHLDSLVKERTSELLLTQQVTIEGLATLAEYRDPETGGHIFRTQSYVRALAEHLRNHPDFASVLNDDIIDKLYRSAPLHDIGKVSIPDSILLKSGKLTDEEFTTMKTHAKCGYDAIARATKRLGQNSFLQLAMEMAYTHHEKWDGSGYPLGLKGEQIPVSGRLMALADVYDALISRRVYKPPMRHQTAVSIISEVRGTHFDPRVVDAFLELEEKFKLIALEFADFDDERTALSD
ncbi:MAG: two-component system response regulator [Deltaproteobacteria bacterium]|nr:two-component system response regulator [Deltaproteobacteria bacterium]